MEPVQTPGKIHQAGKLQGKSGGYGNIMHHQQDPEWQPAFRIQNYQPKIQKRNGHCKQAHVSHGVQQRGIRQQKGGQVAFTQHPDARRQGKQPQPQKGETGRNPADDGQGHQNHGQPDENQNEGKQQGKAVFPKLIRQKRRFVAHRKRRKGKGAALCRRQIFDAQRHSSFLIRKRDGSEDGRRVVHIGRITALLSALIGQNAVDIQPQGSKHRLDEQAVPGPHLRCGSQCNRRPGRKAVKLGG